MSAFVFRIIREKLSMDDKISIILPTYNRENVIGRAIHSILQQTYDRYEILVIDDGSSDQTQEVVKQIADDRIRYIRLEENHGAGYARNVGIQESKYDYIAFLDSDDEWKRFKLELQIQRMKELSREVGLVYCRMAGERGGGRGRFYVPAYEYDNSFLEGHMFQFLLRKNVIGTPTMLFRRECLEQAEGFKTSLRCMEDYELVLRVARNWEIGFVDEELVEIHKTEGSLTCRVGDQLVCGCYIVSKYRQEMAAFGILDAVKADIMDLACRHGVQEGIAELLTRDFEL